MKAALRNYLMTAFDIEAVPVPLSNGGTDYIRGHEHARKHAMASLAQLGNLNGIEPVICAEDMPADIVSAECYSLGFNECLKQACHLLEETRKND